MKKHDLSAILIIVIGLFGLQISMYEALRQRTDPIIIYSLMVLGIGLLVHGGRLYVGIRRRQDEGEA